MAKLPARQKVTVLIFRRSSPDEILVVQREVKGAMRWALPSEELDAGESAREVALRLAADVVEGSPASDLDLGVGASYRVSAGPWAGEWTERYHGVEMPPEARANEGQWFAHYDAKAHAGADAPRVREAISRLREVARLKP